ncbi:MFS transporter [Lichenicoccus sp.]|uniref:MFS transporter n=1 Tax=Lichenicoccus sp. TaxID=2781899 RepID=UPI003D122A41
MRQRWVALAIIFGSFIQFTLNWFSIIPMFHDLLVDLRMTPLQLGAVISAFIAGYGVFHLPGGMLAERYGMRTALLAGILIEAVGALVSGLTPSYGLLLVGRFLCGVGGSIYLGSAVGLTTAWFRDRNLAIANGLTTGVAFSLGAAIGLFGWGFVALWIGWRPAIVVGAAISFLTWLAMLFLYPEPPGQAGCAPDDPHHSLASLMRVLGDPTLWIMSIAFVGGYGSYFATAGLLPGYAEQLGASAAYAGSLSAVLVLSGIVGAFIGGWLGDKVLGVVPTFLLGCTIEAGALLAIPFLGLRMLWLPAALIGGSVIMAFVTWIGLPGLMGRRFRPSDVPTAAGLMLTLGAIGGVIIPPLYVAVASRYGAAAGWSMEGFVSLGFALIALAGWRLQAWGDRTNAVQ